MKWVLIAMVVFLVAIQIFQPRRTNPRVTAARSLPAHVRIPDAVYSALIRSCGDCHSNRTHWPWYSQVAPLSWVITDDVNEGRRHMNFEDWETLEAAKQADDRLIGICEEVRKKGMPPFSYRLAHEDSQLKASDIASLCSWSRSFQKDPSGAGGAH